MIDLHVHTACSDGALSPDALVRYAAAHDVSAIAITDHDTTEGNAAAVAAGADAGVEVIAGVELSSQWRGVTFHLLGYGMRTAPPKVTAAFEFFRRSRRERNPKMVALLRQQGIDITLDEVCAAAGGGVVGRPHFAQVLLDKKVVRSLQEAFDRFLGRGASAYVDKARLEAAAAVDVVRAAGGVPVLAHPGLIEQDHPRLLPALLEELVPVGLGGIEAYYSGHTPMQTRRYRQWAAEHKLLVTGGSDFHRPDNGGPQLGTGFGRLWVPRACLDALREQLGEIP